MTTDTPYFDDDPKDAASSYPPSLSNSPGTPWSASPRFNDQDRLLADHSPDATWSPAPYRARKPPYWARTRTWVIVSALLAAVLLVVGGGAAHPTVRAAVLEKVNDYQATGGAGRGSEAGWWDEEQFKRDVRAGRRANGTVVILVNPHSNLYHDLLPTLANVELRFNSELGYPIQLLTDGELPGEEIMERSRMITKGKAQWSLVTAENGWGPPDYVSEADIDAGKELIPGFSTGYRNMCRFFARFHHQHPSLVNYEWIWRLDEGVRFFCELQEDPFMTMINKDMTYGYSNIDNEAFFVVPTLWDSVKAFMTPAQQEHPSWFPEGHDESFVKTEDDRYTLRMYYNNFEIVNRKFLESEPYQAFADYIDHAKGIYTERWGDAPIRTIALSYFVPSSKIHSFSNVTGYWHDTPVFECPDLPYCYCNPEKSRQNSFGEWW